VTLRVLHGEGGVLVDRTLPDPPPIVLPDTILQIFASVASLSPFVIAQLGPEPLLQVAHDGLVALRQRTTDPRKGRALDAAIGALRAALAHWIDAFHVGPAGGVSTAIDTAVAVAVLAAYRRDPAVHLAINQILGADLELVRTIVAEHSGGDPTGNDRHRGSQRHGSHSGAVRSDAARAHARAAGRKCGSPGRVLRPSSRREARSPRAGRVAGGRSRR